MERLRLGLEWFLNPDHLPILIGMEKGWFAEEGLELEMIEPHEHSDAMEEIEGGRLDVAITEPIHLVSDRAAGDEVIGFARFLHTNGGVMYFRDRGIERPRDMAGRRVQYPGAPGPGGLAIIKTMVEADGGECDVSALTPVNNGFFHTDALIDDKADVATLVFYNFEVVEARNRGYEADFFSLRDWGVPDFCQLILITTPAVLQQKREALRKLLRVIRRGIDFAYQHPGPAEEIYVARSGSDVTDPIATAIFAATLPCFTYDFSMSSDYYARLQEWMHSTGQIQATLPADSYWTNELAL